MPGHDIIVIGASTGGVEAVSTLIGGLPADLPSAIFVVIHFPPDVPSRLPLILNRASELPAAHAADGAPILPGRIYVAPPDRHLMLEPGRVRVVRGPRENRHRPAVDPLFRSAAVAYGPRVVGVVLTGALDDGTAGLRAIKRRGGVAVVQDPDDAFFPSMPASALKYADVDHCLPLADLASQLVAIAREPAAEEGVYPVTKDMEIEVKSAEFDGPVLEARDKPGTLSSFTCPECHGPLWEIHDGELIRFRCRTGHAFTADSALAEQAEALEAALWIALNTLEESAQMARRLADEARGRNHGRVAARFEERAEDAYRRARLVREVLLTGSSTVPSEGGDSGVGAITAS